MPRLTPHLLGVVGEDLEGDGVRCDSLEQPLGELRIVGQPSLPHQRWVRREARDPGIGCEGEDPVEIGAVGEYACGDLLEHCLTSGDGPSPVQSLDSQSLTGVVVEKLRDRVGQARGEQVRGRTAQALVGAARISDQHGPASGGLPGQHVGVGVAQHPGGVEVERQHFRLRQAASPAPACGSRRARRARAPHPRGDAGTGTRPQAPRLLAPAARRPARAPPAAAQASPSPWPPRAGLRRTPARSLPAPAAGRPQAHRGAGARPRLEWRLKRSGHRVGHSLVEDAVPVEERGWPPGRSATGHAGANTSGPRLGSGAPATAHGLARAASDSQWPC